MPDQVNIKQTGSPWLPVFHPPLGSNLVIEQGQFQHNFAWQFIQLCNPELALAEIQARAMSNEPLLDYQI